MRRRSLPGPLHHSLFHVKQSVHHLHVPTPGPGLVAITAPVCAWVAAQGGGTGLLTVWCRHTSCSLLVQATADPDVQADLEAFFVRIAPEGRGLYRHEPLELDNMPSHLRAALTAVQVSVPVEDGRPTFGRFQELYLFEHQSGPHDRVLVLHLIGVP